jgi:hypothetical protein
LGLCPKLKDSYNSYPEGIQHPSLSIRNIQFYTEAKILLSKNCNHMNLLEIKLENPIGHDEVIRLRSELISAKRHDFLIIDTGAHDFLSINVIEHLRDQLSDLEPCLMKFKKIALIHLPQYLKECSNPDKYNFFTSKENATEWLLETY